MQLNNESNQPLKWEPHLMPAYDETLKRKCQIEHLSLSKASSRDRLNFINDTREVHKRLYSTLTPAQHPEYAGFYRGTPGTTLEGRRIGTLREDSEEPQEFMAPEKVSLWIPQVGMLAKKIFDLPSETNSIIVIKEIVRLFYIFGLIHPFLDGNGHIQRLIFSVCIMERKTLRLSEEWTIHPRPYDIEIKKAFEAPTVDERLSSLFRVLAPYISG